MASTAASAARWKAFVYVGSSFVFEVVKEGQCYFRFTRTDFMDRGIVKAEVM